MSNEAKMTLEERIVQRIKSDSLLMLAGDEDAITELVRRAVHEALFKERRIPQQWGRDEIKDPLVVESAKDLAKQAVDRLTEAMVADAVSRPEVRKAFFAAVQELLPGAIMGYLQRAMHEQMLAVAHDAAASHVEAAVKMMNVGPR